MGTATRFVWFWTFWYWGKESFRAEKLLHGPLGDVSSIWDEWFHYEASREDREEIEEATRDVGIQREFVHWFLHDWAVEAVPNGNRMVPAFVLHRLVRVAPFDLWAALEEYRVDRADNGLSAIVLADTSSGKATDVRAVDAIVLPAELSSSGATIVSENFQADAADLTVSRQAALNALGGSGMVRLLVWWILTGRRPYPRWLTVLLAAGWVAVAAIVAQLLFGPEPGTSLPATAAILLILWSTLVGVAATAVGIQIATARSAGRRLAIHLKQDEVRLRMPGRLSLRGGSAGITFCLSILAAVYRAYPEAVTASWLWRQFFERLEKVAFAWAATGVVTLDGQIKPVQIEAKLRACFAQTRIEHILSPRQRVGRQCLVDQSMAAGTGENAVTPCVPRRLKIHSCRSVAEAILKLGSFSSWWQILLNVFAVATSATILAGLGDLRGILFPPPPPTVIAPSSPSPYFVWVSLDTQRPDFFQVVLESPVWANRRADVVARNGTPASVRAEIQLVRLTGDDSRDLEQGTIWIELRPKFLGRNYEPGDRVGRYTLSYVNRLGYE